jgi:hypothetical protein
MPERLFVLLTCIVPHNIKNTAIHRAVKAILSPVDRCVPVAYHCFVVDEKVTLCLSKRFHRKTISSQRKVAVYQLRDLTFNTL